MVGIFANNGASWAAASAVPVNNSGVWQNAQEVWAKENGVWTKVFPAIVREPATGENYNTDSFKWVRITQVNYSAITWDGVTVGNAGLNDTSFTIGNWTYYRGTVRQTNWYALYRIGTP